MSVEIKPYPDSWIRRMDFLPLLRKQCDVGEKKTELFWCGAEVSQVNTRRISEKRTTFGEIVKHPYDVDKYCYQMGNPEPDDVAPVTQKEILEDILGVSGEVPDVVIKTRGVTEPIKGSLASLKELDGSAQIFYRQNAYSNMVHRKRQMSGIPDIVNPYRIIKGQLLSHGFTMSERELLKIRSTLSTEWIITEKKGWSEIGASGILAAEEIMTKPRYWTDIGIPRPFSIRHNGSMEEGRMFMLKKNGGLLML
ncbi:MAG: hypothetical protein WED05_07505 [Candidatus Atabeyarchaeum deiterrae]